jgi:sugar diacid utilization regulator
MVLALLLLLRRTVADAEDRLRGDLLADLLAGRGIDRPRARGLGGQELDLEREAVVLVAATSSDRAGDRRRVAQAVAAWAGEHDGLGGMHDDRAVAVVAADADPASLGEALGARLAAVDAGPVTVGVAAAGAGAAAVAEAGRRAAGVLRTLLTLGRTGETSDETGLGLARLLLGHNGREELAAFVRTSIGPVLDYDAQRGTDLAGTLEAWFAAGGSPAATARRLHVHANTVTQRLERVDSLLGEGWRDPARALEQQLALQIWRLST